MHEDSSSILLQPEDWTNVGHRLAYNLYREYNGNHQKSRQHAALTIIQTKCCIRTTKMYPANEYQSQCISHIYRIHFTLPDLWTLRTHTWYNATKMISHVSCKFCILHEASCINTDFLRSTLCPRPYSESYSRRLSSEFRLESKFGVLPGRGQTVSARERTRRARDGAATHREHTICTPRRARKEIGLIGRD